MKLRLRNHSTKETLKIQLPDSCSLLQLKRIVSERSSLTSSASVHLSLNRKDELAGSNSEDDSLQSLGVTSGDLIFFSIDHNPFESLTLIPQFGNNSSSSSGGIGNDNVPPETVIVEPESSDLETGRGNKALIMGPDSENKRIETDSMIEETLIVEPETGRNVTLMAEHNSENKKNELGRGQNLEMDSNMEEFSTIQHGNSPEGQIFETDSENKLPQNQNSDLGCEETGKFNSEHGIDQTMMGESLDMEIDGDDDVADASTDKGFSVPGFLRKVFNKELGDSDGSDHKLVVIAVHAVLSESGFVGFDTFLKTKTNGFYLPDVWPLSGFTISLCYTLPEIIQSSGIVETVKIKVQNLGKYVNFYGSLAGKGSCTYRVCMDKERLAIVLNLMWAHLDTAVERGSIIHPKKEVFEFWKTVKDKLSLPLLIDLCEVANLPPPPCFSRLPTDLKLMILEPISGEDLAKAACVSKELQFLSSYDDLWEQKFLQEFRNAEVAGGCAMEISWKRKFAKAWEARKRRRRRREVVREAHRPPAWGVPRAYRDPTVFRFPRIIGGDFDLGPNISMGGFFFGRQGRRNVMPRCNFRDRRA